MRHKETSLNSVVVLRNKKKNGKTKKIRNRQEIQFEQKYEIEQTRSNLELHYQH